MVIQNPPVSVGDGSYCVLLWLLLDMLGFPLVMNENKNRNRYGSASDADEDTSMDFVRERRCGYAKNSNE